jgi:hypothetical protein
MSFVSNFVLLAAVVVGLWRRRVVRALTSQGILRDVIAMPHSLERVAQFGIAMGCMFSVLRWVGTVEVLHLPGVGRTVPPDLAMTSAFAFVGIANLLDLLRLRQIASLRSSRATRPDVA